MIKSILTLLLLFIHLNVHAQSYAGINLSGFIPTGELKREASEIWGASFGFEATTRIKNSPLYFGAQLDLTCFGSELRNGYHGADLGNVRFRRQFEMIRLIAILRVKPEFDLPIHPYFDLYLGGGNIYSRSVIRESFFDDPIDSYVDHHHWSAMYGLGLGYSIFLSDEFTIDLSIRSMRSGRVQFLSPESTYYNEQTEQYELTLQSSAFTHLNFGLGVKININQIFQ
jgi:opacity protein-like surface antigen